MWKKWNLFTSALASFDRNWSARFAIICWLLRKRRCAFIFTPVAGALDDILDMSYRLMAECRRAFDNRMISHPGPAMGNIWRKPRTGWVKINVDVAVFTLDSTAGVGLVLRDSNGKWLSGAARAVGCCNVLVAELWAGYMLGRPIIGMSRLNRTAWRLLVWLHQCLQPCKRALLYGRLSGGCNEIGRFPQAPVVVREIVVEEMN
ncbi:hypothetical protein V6N13_142600 [Hibiscus sabdariffa]